MPIRKKVISPAARRTREAFVTNLQRRLLMRYPNLVATEAFERIKRDTGMSVSTLQRAVRDENAPNLDTVADIAHHFGCEAAEMIALPLLDKTDQTNISQIRKVKR